MTLSHLETSPHGAITSAKFSLVEKRQWNGKQGNGVVSVALPSPLSVRAFLSVSPYVAGSSSWGDLSQETRPSLPCLACFQMMPRGCQVLSPFVIFWVKWWWKELRLVSLHGGKRVLRHLDFFFVCFRQRHCQGFWFWWIGLTNVLSTAASSDPAELKRNRGGYGAPQQLSLSQGGIIYWHIYIPPWVTSWQSWFPIWNVASHIQNNMLECWGNDNMFYPR